MQMYPKDYKVGVTGNDVVGDYEEKERQAIERLANRSSSMQSPNFIDQSPVSDDAQNRP